MLVRTALLISLSTGFSRSITRICRLGTRANFEPFFVLATITVLVLLATKSYLPALDSAKLTHAMGGVYINTRVDAMTYYALHGEWPKDNSAMQGSGHDTDYREIKHPSLFVQEATVVDGAIHLHFSNDLEGEVLTIRPALPKDSPETVIWVCGNQGSRDEWTVVGKDETTFDNRLIMRSLW